MALEINHQILETINRGRHLLLVFGPHNEGDGALASLAVAEIFKKMGKQVEVTGGGFIAPGSFKFLAQSRNFQTDLSPLQKFIIKIDLSKNKLASLSYEVKNDNLFIYITPRTGFISHEAVKTASTELKFDAIFVIDTPDLDALGDIYHNNTELFTRVPLINIDHNPANEHFGKINLVDISALSSSEIIFEFLQKNLPDHLTPEIATLLLAGIIIKTKNFRSPNINSRLLQNASRLVELGAKRDEIVQNLYRCRTLPTLKLWGRALANLKNDSRIGLVWTSLTRDDFIASGSTPRDLPEIIDELIANSPEAKIIVLLYETDRVVEGIISVHPHLDAKLLTKPFNPEGSKERVKIIIRDKELLEAEREVIENIEKMRNAQNL